MVDTNGTADAASLEQEVAFLSGFSANGQLAAKSFATWNYDTPPTYSDQSAQFKWGVGTAGQPGGTVSYAFDASAQWTAAERRVLVAGLTLWSDEANIAFAPARGGQAADFTFERGSDGSAYENNSAQLGPVGTTQVATPTDTVISIDTRPRYFGPIDRPFAFQSFPLSTVVHEEGHVIGLGHTGPYDGGTAEGAAAAQLGPYDQGLYSVMSYIASDDTTAPFYGDYANRGDAANAQTPMIADILAAQRLYGAPPDSGLAGGQVFGFNCNIEDATRLFFDFTRNTRPAVTLFDTGTDNTLDLSGFSANATINLAPGTFSSCAGLTDNIAIAYGTAINTAIGGSGDDFITGTTGDDTLVGGGGNDTMTGNGGHDSFVVSPGDGKDLITGFAVAGPNRDTLALAASTFSSRADLWAHTSMIDGSAVIALDPDTSVTLDHVSKAALMAHPRDVSFV